MFESRLACLLGCLLHVTASHMPFIHIADHPSNTNKMALRNFLALLTMIALLGFQVDAAASRRRKLKSSFDIDKCSGFLSVDCGCAARQCGNYCRDSGAASYVLDDCGDGFLWDYVYCSCYDYEPEPQPQPKPQPEPQPKNDSPLAATRVETPFEPGPEIPSYISNANSYSLLTVAAAFVLVVA